MSNTAGRNPDTKEIPEDVSAQTRQVFANIERALAAVGASLADVVMSRVFIQEPKDTETVMTIVGEKFRGTDPASTVTCPPLGSTVYKVEIEVTAYRGASSAEIEKRTISSDGRLRLPAIFSRTITMAPAITPVQTSPDFPKETTVVVIGAGIVGLTAALTLAERGIPVVVLEKGRVAGEQSSRNLGWCRKMGRSAPDVPMAVAADQLWAEMPQRVGVDVGYRQAGIMYLARTEAEMEMHRGWMKSVSDLSLDSKLMSASEIDGLVPVARVNGRAASSPPPTAAPSRRWPPAPLPMPPRVST